jgi:5,6-dimethylbenzimidazole synthase
MDSAALLRVIKKRRSVRVYKASRVSDKQLQSILEAARRAPSGANTQPWEFVVTRDKKKMQRCREIYYREWQERKREDPINYKGLSKYYVGDASVLVLVCADPRTQKVYLTTRQPADREKLFQASVASAVEQMMLVAASLGFGTVWVSVREEIDPELRELFKVPQPIRLLWVVPIGRARFWPSAKPRRKISDFTHYEFYEPKKMRDESWIKAWPKG